MQIYKAKANCFDSSSISISVEDRFCFICECEINNSFQFLGKCNREKLEIETEVTCPEKISPSVNALINVSIHIYQILIDYFWIEIRHLSRCRKSKLNEHCFYYFMDGKLA